MLLELADVVKRYPAPEGGEPIPVLNGVSLQADSGDSIAIVGPSGSGKSTLLNLIGALDRPDSGRIALAGRELSGMSARELAAVRAGLIGFVFQLHHLLPQCTVLENVLLPTLIRSGAGTRQVRENAMALLDRVGLSTRAGHRPGQLSGGERQRAALVRALINHPPLLLADEPTGSLDASSAAGLAGLLRELNEERKTTLVLATHSIELASAMKSVFLLRDGRLERSPR